MKKILSILLLASSLYGIQQVNSGLSFLQLGIGARGVSLGGSGTGISGPEAVFYNPAGLSRLNWQYALFTHSEWLTNIRYDYVSYGQPLSYGYLGFGLKGLYTTDLEKRIGDSPEPISSFGAYGFCGTICYAYPLTKIFALGANLSIIDQILDSYSGFTFAFGFGAIYKTPISGLDIGLALINLGPKLKLNTQYVPLPTQLRLGAAYFVNESFPRVFVDLTKGSTAGFGIGSGMEYMVSILALRAGYASNGGITLGLGISLGRFGFDYGFQPYTNLGFSHRITVSYNWEPVSQIHPDDRWLALMRVTGDRYYNDGLSAMAIGNFDEAKRDFDIAQIWVQNNTKATEKYEEADKKGKEKTINDHYQRAENYFNNKNYLEAVSELEYIISIDSSKAKANLLLAQAQNQLGRPVKGESDFDAGLSYYAQGKYNEAIIAWEKVFKENPDRTDIQSYIEAAKGKIRQCVDSLLDDASKLERQALHKQALNILNRALTLDSQNQSVLSKIGEIRNSMLKDMGAHLYKGIDSFDKHDYLTAESEFQSVLTYDSNNRDAKDYLKRIKSLKAPTHQDLLQKNIMAITAYVSNDYETSIRLWEEILNEDPNFPDAKKNLTRARAMLQKMNR
jgi:tetratricopeptide (TPR) repeat protein